MRCGQLRLVSAVCGLGRLMFHGTTPPRAAASASEPHTEERDDSRCATTASTATHVSRCPQLETAGASCKMLDTVVARRGEAGQCSGGLRALLTCGDGVALCTKDEEMRRVALRWCVAAAADSEPDGGQRPRRLPLCPTAVGQCGGGEDEAQGSGAKSASPPGRPTAVARLTQWTIAAAAWRDSALQRTISISTTRPPAPHHQRRPQAQSCVAVLCVCMHCGPLSVA